MGFCSLKLVNSEKNKSLGIVEYSRKLLIVNYI